MWSAVTIQTLAVTRAIQFPFSSCQVSISNEEESASCLEETLSEPNLDQGYNCVAGVPELPQKRPPPFAPAKTSHSSLSFLQSGPCSALQHCRTAAASLDTIERWPLCPDRLANIDRYISIAAILRGNSIFTI